MVGPANLLAFGLLAVATAASSSAPDAQLAPEIEQDLAMRTSWQAPIPRGEATIYVHSASVHHVRTDQSLIAWRDGQGRWSVSRVVQDGPGGLLAIEKRMTLNAETPLPAADGRRLDALLRERGLYAEKPRRTGTATVGGASHVMEIVAPAGHVVVRWEGRLEGRLGEVADGVLGPGR